MRRPGTGYLLTQLKTSDDMGVRRGRDLVHHDDLKLVLKEAEKESNVIVVGTHVRSALGANACWTG